MKGGQGVGRRLALGLGLGVLGALLNGCLDDRSGACAALVCPAGTTCARFADGGALCVDPDQRAACDALVDGEVCRVDATFGTCREGTCVFADCGDGVIGAGESCDGADLDGLTCQAFGYTDGALACSDECQLDFADCRGLCGDGVIGGVEECDQGDANSQAPGAECRLDCTRARCGDRVVDPVEVCDDGNNGYGDGCAATCDSDETCGNGVVDFAVGEQCDDGRNHVTNDGCTDLCTAEIVSWYPVSSPAKVPRVNTEMIFDPGRGELIEATGTSDGWRGSVVAWSGGAWTEIDAAPGPVARYGAASAYDPERREVLLFGGRDQTRARLGDTWRWRGAGWVEATPTTSPSPRGSPVMGWDPISGRMLLFGGAPPIVDGQPRVVGDTWAWTGDDWMALTPASSPSPRKHHAMATDPLRREIVLFGGNTTGGATGQLGDTWVWTGATWIQRTPAASPVARSGHAMGFDPTRGVVAMASGRGIGVDADTWYWNGTAWAAQATSAAPPVMRYHVMVYDRLRGVVVLVGRSAGVRVTWEWDGGRWTQRERASAPYHNAAAFDENLGRVVMQLATPQPWGNLLAWTGTTWVEVPSMPTPPQTVHPALGFDPRRRRLVMFGGRPDGGATTDAIATTWEFDGASWQQVATPSAPPARHSGTFAFDEDRGALILFGGRTGIANNAADLVGDTWAYDGAWAQVASALSPPARTGHTATWDDVTRRVVVFGGIAANGAFLGDTWALGPAGWSPLSLPLVPTARTRTAMVYDPARRAIALFGGKAEGGILADQWSLQARGAIVPDRCDGTDADGDGLRGCADPDCAAVCEPTCHPPLACPMAPRCGDGVCDPVLESSARCPGDCPSTSTMCGDGVCGDDELTSTCPADCAQCGDLRCDAPFESAATCSDCGPSP
ncbi:MAG: kelch repeat-containing protein [Kofleriaceae bacterium]